MERVNKRTGQYVVCSTAGETFKAYVPPPLPPDPPISLDDGHFELMEKANRELGQLDGFTKVLPDARLLLYMYIRKEALLSSQIEGTQSSFSDLLLYEEDEAPGVPIDDVKEVSCYIAAMEQGLKRIREDNFPLSLRLIKEIHAILLSKGRGSHKESGEFRKSQNWIGGTRPGNAAYVPPPPDKIMECMGDLEKFLHNIPQKTPTLIKAALAHAQFETIHPFLDGNGRIGRLLITLVLCAENALAHPSLYLSLYFKLNRQEYYDRLQSTRRNGDFEEWIRFFLKGVHETSEQGVLACQAILHLFNEDAKRIKKLKRAAITALRVHQVMQGHPITSIPKLAKNLNLTIPTIGSAIKHLEDMGIVREITGKQRHRLFVYGAYLDILKEGVG